MPGPSDWRKSLKKSLFTTLALVTALLGAGLPSETFAQKGPATTLVSLPQDHEYQKTLRNYMATLTEKDFDHGVSGRIPLDSPLIDDVDYLYRGYMISLMHQPLIGNKRGTPAVTSPPKNFLLANIESPKGVLQPPVWPETLTTFIHWDYPGNLYRNNRGLKLRAFVGGALQMMMIHNFAEQNDPKSPPPIRPDWHGYTPMFFAEPYPAFKDVLPPEVQKAYETGLKMIGERMLSWGVRGESCEHDLMMPTGLFYISRAINDAEFTKKVDERIKLLFTDKYLHPAGYWLERGGIDTGFGGTANYFANWLGLMTDWPEIKDALARIYRLRAHLILPDPDGYLTGPSHFNSRLGTPASLDQFAFDGARDSAASLITDEAASSIKTPTPEEMKAGIHRRAHAFNEDMGENPRITENGVPRYIRDDEIKNEYPWKLRMWMTYNFPVSINPAYEYYKKGAYAHRRELEAKNSPMLKSPFLRGENFVRDFEKAFIITRQPGFAAIFHTGPIGWQSPDDNKGQYKGPLGLSGGQLSAFWTPSTGSVILGMRRWMSFDKPFDTIEAWRTWPNHSVNGATTDGTFFTSARIQKPDVAVETAGGLTTVKVSGTVPATIVGQEKAITGKYDVARTFKISDKTISVATTISGDGKDQVAELYETIPVFLRDLEKQTKATPTAIEFQIDGAWKPATDQYASVKAVKLTRFSGAVIVTFDKPARVKLAPEEWTDTGFTKSACRNVLIDLLGSASPAAIKEARSVSYSIAPAQ